MKSQSYLLSNHAQSTKFENACVCVLTNFFNYNKFKIGIVNQVYNTVRKRLLKLFLTATCLLILQPGHSQMGINTLTPDSSSILDIKSDDRGLLLPRMSTSQRLNGIKTPADGLMVYDTDMKMFFFWNAETTHWESLNPWQYGNSNSGSTDISSNSKLSNKNVVVEGDVKARGFKGYGITPLGGIIPWSGNVTVNFDGTGKGIGDLDGWAICNGHDTIPDLRGRFIVGYNGSNYVLGSTGGSNSITLTKANIPTHNHSVQADGATINITNSGDHIHTGTTTAIFKQSKSVGKNSGGGEGAQDDGALEGEITIVSSTHTHPNTSFNGVVGNGTSDGLGTQTAIDIRPSYYSLIYIMRIK